MNNNDILRRMRYAFDYTDSEMMRFFELGGLPASRAEVSDWLKPDDNEAKQNLYDQQLASFLNGWIIARRGPREGEQAKPEKSLNNNQVFRKLRIGLSMRDEDILEVLALADFKISKHELSAFFRTPEHPSFRVCKDQVLRNFLQGLQRKFRKDVG